MFTITDGEKFVVVIVIGYGVTQGAAHQSKAASAVSRAEDAPEWFKKGVEAALLAPTALNHQKFSVHAARRQGVRQGRPRTIASRTGFSRSSRCFFRSSGERALNSFSSSKSWVQ